MKKYSIWGLLALLNSHVFATIDDVDLKFRAPHHFFAPEFSLLDQAKGEVWIGRYLVADDYHGAKGGALGDVNLISFNANSYAHLGLGIETLIDDQNDINFRLVQTYYQALLGLGFKISEGLLSLDYQHRCSHGSDHAVDSRIMIRSGPRLSFHWPWHFGQVRLDLRAVNEIYLLAQNADLSSFPLSSLQLHSQLAWPIRGRWSMLVALGGGLDIHGESQKVFATIFSEKSQIKAKALFAGRLAMVINGTKLRSEFSLHFNQSNDTSLLRKAEPFSSLSFDLNFFY